MKSKLCHKCNTTRPASEFYKRTLKNKVTLQPWCKKCCHRYHKANYPAKKEAYRARERKYKIADPDKLRERQRCASKRWRDRNITKCRKTVAAYRKTANGIASRRRSDSMRRAKRKISDPEASLLIAGWRKLPEMDCYWCGRSVPSGMWEVDHAVPLSKWGTHEAANLVAACYPCNRAKGAKMPYDFERELWGKD